MKKYVLILFLFFTIFSQSIIRAQSSYDYLIITPDIFTGSGSTWVTDLMDLQTSRGYHPIIEQVSTGDSREYIKSRIAYYYNTYPIKYVLFVGNGKTIGNHQTDGGYQWRVEDTDSIVGVVDFITETYIPFWMLSSNDPFSSTGSSDVASDDPYIEGLNSHGAVYLGRIPVGSKTEANNYVSKLTSYYQKLSSPIYSPGMNREILLIGDVTCQSNGCAGELVTNLNNELINNHIPITTEIIQLKVSENNSCPSQETWKYCPDRQTIFENTLNQGAAVISILSTTGGPENFADWYWGNDNRVPLPHPPIGFNLSNINTGMPFLFAPNCTQGAVHLTEFESTTRKLLIYPNGGIIGAIAPTYGSEQHANGYVLNLFNDLIHQDELLTYSEIFKTIKDELVSRYSGFAYFYNSLIYLGDPSLVPSIYKHRSGNIASNTTWNGNYVIDAPLTVESDFTLNLSPGTNLFFNTGVNLTVDGTLYANKNKFALAGLTNDRWGYIDFTNQFSSGSYLTNCEIINSAGLKMRNGADIMLDNNHIKNSTQGIYIYNSQPIIINNYIEDPVQNGIYGDASGLSPIIQGNKIYKFTNMYSYQGIYFGNNTNARIIGNDVNGFLYGAYLGGGCYTETMLADGYSPYPNNRFMNNRYGITTAWGSSTIAGWDDQTAAFNSFYGNQTYDAYCYQHSWLVGYYDYWGLNPQLYADGTSFLEVEEFLPENPWDQKSKKLSASVISLENQSPLKTDTLSIFEGILLERQGKINQAINFYKKLIHDDIYVDFAFAKLLDIKNRYDRKELKGYFKSIANSNNIHKAKLKKIVADLDLNDDLFYSAISNYNNAISISNSYDGINARFAKLFAYANVKNDIDSARILLSELRQLNLTEDEFLMKLQMADNLLSEKRFIKSSQTVEPVVNSYDIAQNYPNPFNPTTTIRYQIPEDGMVTLKVYDILGREVKTLVNDFKTKGRYEVTFDASNLASGLYIYEITSGDYKASKKMTLIK